MLPSRLVERDETYERIVVTAERLLATGGMDAFSREAVAEELGIEPDALPPGFETRAALLREVAVRFVSGPVEPVNAIVAQARSAEEALETFMRGLFRFNMSHADGFLAHLHMADPHYARQYEITDAFAAERFVPANDALYGPVAARLAEQWGQHGLPHGIHPRRLVFVAHLCVTGFSWFKSAIDSTGTSAKHDDDDVVNEMIGALVAPLRALRQLRALNTVATELAAVRDEPTLVARVPRLLCDGLDVDRALLMLVDGEGVLRLVSVAGRDEPEARSAELLDLVRADRIPAPPHYRQCLQQGETIFAPEPRAHPDWPRPTAAEVAEAFGELHPDAPFVVAPVRSQERTVGIVACHARVGGRMLDHADVSRIETFTTLVGLTLENVRFYATLHERVEERTRELRAAQTRLVQSEKLASTARLVAGVVHEFNTPLGAVLSGAQTLASVEHRLSDLIGTLGEAADGVALERLRRGLQSATSAVAEGSARVHAIVERLRSFARLDAAERDRVELNAMLGLVLEMLEPRRPPGVELRRELGELPRVECYPARLNDVFMNLLSNAYTAMPDGGTLTVRTRADGDGHVVLEVLDTGVGIEPELQRRLFEPSFSSHKGRVSATLGLATCSQIVHDHGGELSVRSAPGQGSTFTVRLPVELG